MELRALTLCVVLFSCMLDVNKSKSTQHLPRMVFTHKESVVKTLHFHGHHHPVKIIPQRIGDAVVIVGQNQVMFYDFQKGKEPRVLWDCSPQRRQDCKIILVQEVNGTDQVLVCYSTDRNTHCCQLDLSSASPSCSSTPKIRNIVDSIKYYALAPGEPSVLVESGDDANLYVTRSGQEGFGIYRYGSDEVGPTKEHKEQHFLGLMASKRREDPLQNKVYAFYKERNSEKDPQSHTWIPFVSQVCMADIGGPRRKLQFKWTSQMYAKLFCGNADGKQSYSELVDVATVEASRWQDSRVYGIFRNEWGGSAVCVYTAQDIDHVFKNSTFKGSTLAEALDRPRECVENSNGISYKTLDIMEKYSEMEQWVKPMNNSGPILSNPHHNFTKIYVDGSHHMKNNHQAVLFIILNNGVIHKVIQHQDQILVAAEYQPFMSHVHILSIVLQTPSRRLLVASESELVQLDVENCGRYGDSCIECALARDPYCIWDNDHCTPHIQKDVQNGTAVNFADCPARSQTDPMVQTVTVPYGSKYFLRCPVTSHYAVYSWNHQEKNTICRNQEQHCFHHIDHMGPEDAGIHTCSSEESGYVRVKAKYDLRLESGAGVQRSGWLPWVGVVTLLVKNLFH